MSLRIQHLLEVRFSVWMGRGPVDFAPDWLKERVGLLRRYCLPSVAAQTTGAFGCLLLCDEATDPDVVAELRADERELEPLRLGWTSAGRATPDVVRELVHPDADVLITTRLDSDDAIADDHVEAIQEYAGSFHHGQHRDVLVNFVNGRVLDETTGRLYGCRLTTSPFHSLLERPHAAAVRTVLHTLVDPETGERGHFGPLHEDHVSHALLHEHHVTHQDESTAPAWLQVLHGGNLSNRLSPMHRPLPPGTGLERFTLATATPTRAPATPASGGE